MPWVQRHRRRLPGSWFRTTTVDAHHRRRAGHIPWLPILVVVAVILVLVALF
ncbi:hypothetical protein GCM10022243_12320 [Saccharothrix violaceirubra]|uniref:Uncharacterized protein n=1 Tax=Saccharothrix violaceirubra TaxID=413306 RepID=A0A7W7WZ75_9PSEU|nr:hypothetical protein [Saccharothrix violaceirubra]MBB4968731.1 hypothetical protein [Saccharothrix violaceirubra]